MSLFIPNSSRTFRPTMIFFFCLYIFVVIFYLTKIMGKIDRFRTSWLATSDERPTSMCSDVKAMYHEQKLANGSTLTDIFKQRTIGVCINFNHDPDINGTTLRSLLKFYTQMHKYILFLTPSPFVSLSEANQAILRDYQVMAFGPLTPSPNGHIKLNISHSFNSSLFQISCSGSHAGFYQYICTSLCAQLFQHIKRTESNVKLRGVLYLPDDVFFNFSLIASRPQYYDLDEFWISPAQELVDTTRGKGKPSSWHWWHVNNHWNRFYEFFFEKKSFSNILEIIYGPFRLPVSGLSDLAYIPFADNQLKTFVENVDTIMTLFPGAFCELIFPLMVDITSAMCKHWPYQHDRILFNSKANRLNNLTVMRDLEAQKLVLHARDSSNSSLYRRRPCLFNADGSVWGAQRKSEILYRQTIFSSRSPLTNRTEDNQIDYVHPMKLSNKKNWQYILWHEAMEMQIQKLRQFQQSCL